jgi:hypothetical protein
LGGFSLLEAAFAAAIVGVSFVTLFALNTQCLYFVNSSRELTTAGQVAQSRTEQFRNLTWAQITDPIYIRDNVLNAPVNAGASSLGAVTEVVKINKYPTAVSPGIQVTRVGNATGGGSVTSDTTPNAVIATADMWTISLQLTWTAAPVARSRTMTVSTIYGKNTQ